MSLCRILLCLFNIPVYTSPQTEVVPSYSRVTAWKFYCGVFHSIRSRSFSSLISIPCTSKNPQYTMGQWEWGMRNENFWWRTEKWRGCSKYYCLAVKQGQWAGIVRIPWQWGKLLISQFGTLGSIQRMYTVLYGYWLCPLAIFILLVSYFLWPP